MKDRPLPIVELPWLVEGEFHDPVWIVCDTQDRTRTAVIDFRFRLADGSCITDHANLLATVKACAKAVRDPVLTRTEDAERHRTIVVSLMYLVHAMTLAGIWSVAALTPDCVSELVDRCQMGVEGLISAPERVEAYFSHLSKLRDADPAAFMRKRRSLRVNGRLCGTSLRRECHLPEDLRTSGVAAAIERGASRLGWAYNHADRTERERPIAIPYLGTLYQALGLLWEIGPRAGCERLPFPPLPDPFAEAAALGTQSTPTPVPPPLLAFWLMEQAFRWVADEGCHVLKALAGVGPGAVLTRVPWERHPRLTLHAALRLTAAACFVLIAAFTARRPGEITELSADCMSGSDREGWWIRIYISKTIQDFANLPVPNTVARAVELMIELSAVARDGDPTASIFQFAVSAGAPALPLSPGGWLDQFAAHVRTPPHVLQDGTEVVWHWVPRAFRRFYAVLFFYRYEHSSVEAISHMLRHFSLEGTRSYILRDAESINMWTATERKFRADLAQAIAAGETMKGGRGASLSKTISEIKAALSDKMMVAPEGASAALEAVIANDGLVIRPNIQALCTCPNTQEAARTASCRRSETQPQPVVGPNPSAATPAVCGQCRYAIVTQQQQRYVEAERAALASSANCLSRAGTILSDLQFAQVARIDAAVCFAPRTGATA